MIKYDILGGNLPVVICHAKEGQTIVSQNGAMSWMSPNMKMTTSGGGVGRMFGRMLANESVFQNKYTAENGSGLIAFASTFPGEIKAIEISPGREIIAQKSAFLASESTVKLSVYFQKRLSSGLFGGEGFIMQKLSGNGMAFLEIDGSAIPYSLQQGEALIVDTGYVAAMDSTCSMEITTVPGLKNKFLGGEGIFNTVIRGPGTVILQTMPINHTASALSPYIQIRRN